MTPRPAAFALLLPLLSASCVGCEPPVGHVDAALSTSGDFPSAAAVLSFSGGFPDFKGGFKSSVSGQGADPNQIHSVNMKSFVMTVTAPAPEDPAYRGLTFLKTMTVKFRANGLTDVVVAHREDFGSTAKPPPTVWPFAVDNKVELKPYLTAPTITVVMEADGSFPPVTHSARVDMVLDVGAVLLKTN